MPSGQDSATVRWNVDPRHVVNFYFYSYLECCMLPKLRNCSEIGI
jgi:hypothetical protein